MVKLIGIIIGIIAVVAFLVVAFVFVDRLIFEGDTLFGKQESMVDEFDKSQNISQSTIAASEQFEMIKPIETSSPLSMEKNRNSVTRYLKELEQKRRVVNFDRVTNAQPNVPDLNITIMENLSEVYLQSVKQDLRRRGFSDILTKAHFTSPVSSAVLFRPAGTRATLGEGGNPLKLSSSCRQCVYAGKSLRCLYWTHSISNSHEHSFGQRHCADNSVLVILRLTLNKILQI